MKRIIFHLPFCPDLNRASASQIRPFKMIQAFKAIGYEVDIVMGSGKERKGLIEKIKNNIKKDINYDFLYSESSTMPTLLTESHHLPTYPLLDFAFFKFCRGRGIPLGLFYRDIHWKFKHYITKVSYIKRLYATFFYKLDIYAYNSVVDVLFLPTASMIDYLPEVKIKKIESLPPGTEEKTVLTPSFSPDVIRILYVGGIGELYNLELFLNAVARLDNGKVSCTICCRRDDFEVVKNTYSQYLDNKNITFTHERSEGLVKLYNSHDICCLFVKPESYWSFAMPVKLFEYISFHKPILCVQNTRVGQFVENEDIGWAIPYNEEALCQWLKDIVHYFDSNRFKTNLQSVSFKHSWEQRAMKVRQILKSVI